MILIDTNVVSEPLRKNPQPRVAEWLDAQAYGALMAKSRSAGRAISVSDSCIAATAAANSMLVVTRDTAPFEAAGLETVNPWSR